MQVRILPGAPMLRNGSTNTGSRSRDMNRRAHRRRSAIPIAGELFAALWLDPLASPRTKERV